MKKISQFSPLCRFKDAWAVFKTLRKGNLGPGSECLLLEEEIKKLTGSKYCFTTTSGTVALIMAIEALKLPRGSTIIFPAYTFLAGANAARFMGYKVKLVDINPYTLCIDVDKLKFNKNISCVIFVNHNAYYGDDIGAVKKFCSTHNIPIIEDSCQSIGMPYAGRTGNVGVFSFSVPKLITGGQGGAVVTDDDKVAKRLGQIRDHGDQWRKDRLHKHIGVNFRYSDIQASYVLSQLRDIKVLLEKRWQVFNNYYINGIRPYRFSPNTIDKESLWMVVYRTHFANEIIEALKSENIQATKYYKCISDNPVYKTRAKFPGAKEISEELVYLPSSLDLTSRQIRRICKIIKRVYTDTKGVK
jgi:perosamine synthetase